MRSFMLPVGLADSSLAITRPNPAGTTLRSSTKGVLSIASRIFRLDIGSFHVDPELYPLLEGRVSGRIGKQRSKTGCKN
jgi:hypothetical protein